MLSFLYLMNIMGRNDLIVLTVLLFLFLITCLHSWSGGSSSSEALLPKQLSDKEFLVSVISLSLF